MIAQDQADKLCELMLYIALRSEGDPHFGSTKLNKLLFACDFLAFRNLGESITNEAYQKLPHGPAARAYLPIVKALQAKGDAVVTPVSKLSYRQDRLVPLRDPDLSCFSAIQIALVDEVLEHWRAATAKQIEDWSHEFPGWQAAAPGESIPYETVFIGERRPMSLEEAQFGEQLADELGL